MYLIKILSMLKKKLVFNDIEYQFAHLLKINKDANADIAPF